MAFFAIVALFASELAPLSEGEAALEFGLVVLFSAAVLLQDNFLTLTATLLNAGFLAWMVFHYHSDLYAAGTIPFLELLILGVGIVCMRCGYRYRHRPRQEGSETRLARSPAAAVPAEPSASLHRQAFEHAAVGLAILGEDGQLLETNRRLREMIGRGNDATTLPHDLDGLIQAGDRPSCRGRLGSLLAGAGAGAASEFDIRLVGEDSNPSWARIALSPYPAGADLRPRIIAAFHEIPDPTDARRAEKDLLELALSSGLLGHWQIDTDENVIRGSDSFWSLLGLPPAHSRRLDELSSVVHPADWSKFLAHYPLAAPQDLGLEIRVRRPDGHIRWVALHGREESRVGGTWLCGIAAGLTERRDGVPRRANALKSEGVVLELRHRLSNLFPTITALANLMDTPDGDVAHYKRALIERIHALQAAHQLLARHPTRDGMLQDIVALTLKPYRREHNITIDGPSIPMSEGTAESFALVVHELATNSLKHGALGTPGGHVSVEWSVPTDSDGDILFLWTEQGRQTMAKSAHLGFGSSILGTCGAPLIGHSPSMVMLEDGLRYSLCLSRNDGSASSPFS